MGLKEKLLVKIGADVRPFNQAMSRVTKSSKSAADAIGRSAKMMALAFMGVVTAAALVGAKFEKSMIETATVAKAFGEDLKALEDKARDLGMTTAFTGTQAAEGMYALASAGMTTYEVIDSIDAAMKFAGATASTMTQSTGLLAATMKQFNLDASESTRITDIFAEAITSSQLTTERLSEAMKYAGTVGAGLGWSLEQTTAAVAQFANLGLEGSMAGTNLRMAMLQLVKGSNKATAALKEVGLTLKDVNPTTHDFGEIIEILGDRSMTAGQAVAIFGARSALNMKQLSALARAGAIDFKSFTKNLVDSQGRAAEMYERMMDTFYGRWKFMTSALQELLITIFDRFKVQGKELFESITATINELTSFIKSNKGIFEEMFTTLAKSLELVVKAVDWLIRKLPALEQVWYSFSTIFIEQTDDWATKLGDVNEQIAKQEKKIKEYHNSNMQAFSQSMEVMEARLKKLREQREEIKGYYKVEKDIEIKRLKAARLEVIRLKELKELNKDMALQDALWAKDAIADRKAITDAVKKEYNKELAANEEMTKAKKKALEDLEKLKMDSLEKLVDLEIEANRESMKWVDYGAKWVEAREKEKIEIIKSLLKELTDANLDEFEKRREKAWDFFEKTQEYAVLRKEGAEWLRTELVTIAKDEYEKLKIERDKTKADEKQAREDRLKAEGTTVEGMVNAWKDYAKGVKGTYETVYDYTKDFAKDITNLLSDAIKAAFAGDMEGLKNVAKAALETLGTYLGSIAGYAIGGPIGAAIGGAIGSAIGSWASDALGLGEKTEYAEVGMTLATWVGDGFKAEFAAIGGSPEFGKKLADSLNEAMGPFFENTNDLMQRALTLDKIPGLDNALEDFQTMFSAAYKSGFEGFSISEQGNWQEEFETIMDHIKDQWDVGIQEMMAELGFQSIEQLAAYIEKQEEMMANSSVLIGEALRAGLETGSFADFETTLYESVYNQVLDSMIGALLQTEMFKAALVPFFEAMDEAMEHIYDPAVFSAKMGDAVGILKAGVGSLKPSFDSISKAVKEIKALFGLKASTVDVETLQHGGEVTATGVALIHKGEVVIPSGIAESLSDSPAVKTLGNFFSGIAGAGKDFAKTFTGIPNTTDPEVLGPNLIGKALIGMIGGPLGVFGQVIGTSLSAAVKEAFGFRGAAFDGPAMFASMFGPIGGLLAPVAGVIGDGIADLFNARDLENVVRDPLEDAFGYIGGRLAAAPVFSDDDLMNMAQNLGVMTGAFETVAAQFEELEINVYDGISVAEKAMLDTLNLTEREMGFVTSMHAGTLQSFYTVSAEELSLANKLATTAQLKEMKAREEAAMATMSIGDRSYAQFSKAFEAIGGHAIDTRGISKTIMSMISGKFKEMGSQMEKELSPAAIEALNELELGFESFGEKVENETMPSLEDAMDLAVDSFATWGGEVVSDTMPDLKDAMDLMSEAVQGFSETTVTTMSEAGNAVVSQAEKEIGEALDHARAAAGNIGGGFGEGERGTGSGEGGGGSGTGSVEHWGGRIPITGNYTLKAGEEVIAPHIVTILGDLVGRIENSDTQGGNGKPMHITVNVAGQQFETVVREWADDVRVEANRRGIVEERLYP